jgi:hypothetical protein
VGVRATAFLLEKKPIRPAAITNDSVGGIGLPDEGRVQGRIPFTFCHGMLANLLSKALKGPFATTLD